MPNPKRRHSKHRKNIRRSHLAITPAGVNHCARCGAAVRTHRICDNCGHYGFKKGGQEGVAVLPKEEF